MALHFNDGAMVMAKDDLRSTKSDPFYEGPFSIVRRQRGGNYLLRASDGAEYIRPPSSLKLVSQDVILPDEHYEVESILDHKKVDGDIHYLVSWKKYVCSHNSWVHHKDFSSPKLISDYWKSLNPNKSKRAPKKRQRSY